MTAKKTTKNFAAFIRAELASNPELSREVEQERIHSDIAEQILVMRSEAKLTQKELAELVGTTQSVISRIEDADYYGHSLSMLQRIADVLKKRLFVIFCNPDYAPSLYGRTFDAKNTAIEINLESCGWNQSNSDYLISTEKAMKIHASESGTIFTPVRIETVVL